MAVEDSKSDKSPVDNVEPAESANKSVEYIEAIELTKDAKIAAQAEHETTLWQCLRSNKKAAMWSAVISLTIIMEGYDIGVALPDRLNTSPDHVLTIRR